MTKKLSSSQFENMISECVGQVLAESRQPLKNPKNKRIKMNESQMQRYVQKIINEELENESFWDGSKAVGKEMLNRFRGKSENNRDSLKQVFQKGDQEGEERKLTQQASQGFEERMEQAQRAVQILRGFYQMCKGNNIANVKGLPMIIGQLNKILANVNYEAGQESYRNSIVQANQGGYGMNRDYRQNVGRYKMGRY